MRVLLTSFRFDHPDGVSVEAGKLAAILAARGDDVFRLAGSFGAVTSEAEPRPPAAAALGRDIEIKALGIEEGKPLLDAGLFGEGDPVECERLLDESVGEVAEPIAKALDQVDPDLVIAENVFGLPLNTAFTAALGAELLRRKLPALLWHHDLIWQRGHFGPPVSRRAAQLFPLDAPHIRHVVINDLSRTQMKERGFDARVVRNGFAFDRRRAAADAPGLREELGLGHEVIFFLQPTRAIPRKCVSDSISLAGRVSRLTGRPTAVAVSGPAEEGFGNELGELAVNSEMVEVILCDGECDIDALYESADFVLLPSTWEGFGNPVIESVAHRRPIFVRRYPVLPELEGLGLRLFDFDNGAESMVRSWLNGVGHEVLDENEAVARRHFSLDRLREDVRALIADVAASTR